jgi:putative ABC transport system permease protein
VRPSNVINLYWVRLRPRLVQELLALAGITIGVALVFAALVANTSLTGSVKELTRGVIGEAQLQLAARGPDGFDERLVRRVERIDGVDAAAPVLELRANLIGPSGRESVLFVAGDQRFSSLGGTLLPHFTGVELARQETIALPQPMAEKLGASVGQPLPVEIAGRTIKMTLGAQLQQTDIGQLVDSPVALATLAYAQRRTGLDGRVSRIFVRVSPNRTQEVAASLRRIADGRLDVRAANADVKSFEEAAYPTNQSTALFSFFSALVGFLLAFSAMLLTVPQRQRLIADLQMAGHPRWVLLELLLFDALVLGVLGAGLGLILGQEISQAVFGAAPDYLTAAFAVGSQQVITWQSAAIAGGAGVLAAVVAVLAPLRDVLMRHPMAPPASDTQSAGGRWTALAGLLCVAVTAAIIVLAPAAAIAGIATLTLGLLLLLPLVLRLATTAFEAVSRNWKSPVPTLVVLELRSRKTRMRTLALSATGAVAVFATVAIGGGNADLRRGLDQSARDIDSNADIWVTFAGRANTLGTTAFSVSREKVDAIEEVPGVESVRAYRGGFLEVGDHRAWVIAPPRDAAQPVPPSQIKEGHLSTAAAQIARGGWITISESIADDENVGVGDTITLPTPVPTRMRIAAVTSNLAWPPGAVVLNADDYREAWGSDAVAGLNIEIASGASPAVVARGVRRALGPNLPLSVETQQQRTLRHYATARNALSRLNQISALVLASAVLAMAAAMGGMIWQRRPSVARLKVHGFSEIELWNAMLLESGLLLGTACLVGGAFGLLGQVLLSRALEVVTGFPLIYTTAAVSALGILALVTSVAVAMLALPGWLAVRVRPARGLPA